MGVDWPPAPDARPYCPKRAAASRRRSVRDKRRRAEARALKARQAEARSYARALEALIVAEVAALACTLRPSRGHPVIRIADRRIGDVRYF